MKLIIAGSRTLKIPTSFTHDILAHFLPSPFPVTEVVSGGAEGVDRSGEQYASFMGIPCQVFRPDWRNHGQSAGPIRNREMANYGDALLVIWDGKSRGSYSMRQEMKKLKRPIYEVIIRKVEYAV